MPTNRFDNEKEQALRKLATIDKSKKGSIDPLIVPIVRLLNKHEDYYTTSSCSGRIMVLAISSTRKKNDTAWLYTTHSSARAAPAWECLGKRHSGEVWLKQEAAILHAACRTMDAAACLLTIVRNAGFKRAGIIATSRRIMLEIIGTDAAAIPLAFKGAVHADKRYVAFAVRMCNARLAANAKKLKQLTAMVKANFGRLQ